MNDKITDRQRNVNNLTFNWLQLEVFIHSKLSRYHLYGKAALCQACYSALRLTRTLESKGIELLSATLKPSLPFTSGLSLTWWPTDNANTLGYPPRHKKLLKLLVEIERHGLAMLPVYGESHGPTVFILKSLAIPTNTTIYLAAADGQMETEVFTSVYINVYTKSSFLSDEDFAQMHGNTKAALDYHVSINSDAYIAAYFGNMDKMVSAMRALKGFCFTYLKGDDEELA